MTGAFGSQRHTKESRAIAEADHPPSAFVQRIKTRINPNGENRDAVIAITGPEGVGKSTCGFVLASQIDPEGFSTDRVAWTTQDYFEVCQAAPHGSVVMRDEGVGGLNRRAATTRENRDLTEFLYIARALNLAHIVCFPRFGSLDFLLTQHRLWAWIRVKQRGKAEVRLRDRRVPVADEEPEALDAFPLAARMSFPKVDTEEWDRYEREKEKYLQRDLNARLDRYD